MGTTVVGIGFTGTWLATTLGVALLAAVLGWVVGKNVLRILVDSRGRYSLNHFQLVMWTLLVMGTWIAVLFLEGFASPKVVMSQQVLGLIGVSLGSGALTGAVKAAKDGSPTARVAVAGQKLMLSTGHLRGDGEIKAHLSQIFLQEEGDLADQVIDVTKFQNFLFTVVAGAMFVGLVFQARGMPTLSENLVWVLGVSHAGYVAAKVPNKK